MASSISASERSSNSRAPNLLPWHALKIFDRFNVQFAQNPIRTGLKPGSSNISPTPWQAEQGPAASATNPVQQNAEAVDHHFGLSAIASGHFSRGIHTTSRGTGDLPTETLVSPRIAGGTIAQFQQPAGFEDELSDLRIVHVRCGRAASRNREVKAMPTSVESDMTIGPGSSESFSGDGVADLDHTVLDADVFLARGRRGAVGRHLVSHRAAILGKRRAMAGDCPTQRPPSAVSDRRRTTVAPARTSCATTNSRCDAGERAVACDDSITSTVPNDNAFADVGRLAFCSRRFWM